MSRQESPLLQPSEYVKLTDIDRPIQNFMPQSSEVAVEFRDVSFQINDRAILSHLDLTIYQGETIVLLGDSR